MASVKWDDVPIIRGINPHTGVLDGDDTGYRDVPVCQLDAEDPDPLVVLENGWDIQTYPLYFHGATPGLCPNYPKGLGAPNKTLVRRPIAEGLVEVDADLRPYNRRVVVLDSWRPCWTQADMWVDFRRRMLQGQGLVDGTLDVGGEVRIGMLADKMAVYAKVVENDTFFEAADALLSGELSDQVHGASQSLGLGPVEVAKRYLIFQANLGRNQLLLDEAAPTPHGNGGAIDLWMVNTETGKYVNMGVPFDYIPPPGTAINPTVMNYFDHPGVTYEMFLDLYTRDPNLRQYFAELGIFQMTPEVFCEAQIERRRLFHSMMARGASYYSLGEDEGEPWHFQFGNERGGNQQVILLGSGNTCHALLKGKPQAVWSNAVGHKLAAEMGFVRPAFAA